MTEPLAPRLAETYAEVEDALLSRWPETRLEPSLDRIRAFAPAERADTTAMSLWRQAPDLLNAGQDAQVCSP